MAKILLGLGSNVDPENNLAQGIHALRALDAQLTCSPVYQSRAEGFDGDDFLNLVVLLDFEISLEQLSTGIASIEERFGRDRNEPRFSAKTLDIDILLFNNLVGQFGRITLPREEITANAFVLKPLADLSPDLIHPIEQVTISALWKNLGPAMQAVTALDIQF